MKTIIRGAIKESIAITSLLLYDEKIIAKIQESARLIIRTLKKGGKVLIFGNGGSAADSQHFAAELVGKFQKERKGLAAIALSTDTSIITSLANDYSFDIVFRRQIQALAKPNDLAFAISTSGSAKNVIEGIKEAKRKRLKTVCLTGADGGQAGKIADLSINAPCLITARIQEIHILIIHLLCKIVEGQFKK